MGDFEIENMYIEVNPFETSDTDESICFHRHSYELSRTSSKDKEYYEWHIPKYEDELMKCDIDGIEGKPSVSVGKDEDERPRWSVKIEPKHLRDGKVSLKFESYQPSRRKKLFSIPGFFSIYQYLFRVGSESKIQKGKFLSQKPDVGRIFMHGINVFPNQNNDLEMELNNQDPYSITFISAIYFKSKVFDTTRKAWLTIFFPILLAIISSIIFKTLFPGG